LVSAVTSLGLLDADEVHQSCLVLADRNGNVSEGGTKALT